MSNNFKISTELLIKLGYPIHIPGCTLIKFFPTVPSVLQQLIIDKVRGYLFDSFCDYLFLKFHISNRLLYLEALFLVREIFHTDKMSRKDLLYILSLKEHLTTDIHRFYIHNKILLDFMKSKRKDKFIHLLLTFFADRE